MLIIVFDRDPAIPLSFALRSGMFVRDENYYVHSVLHVVLETDNLKIEANLLVRWSKIALDDQILSHIEAMI